MIAPEEFIEALRKADIRLVTGVPDSLLKDVCACITKRYSSKQHIIATNEGSAIAMAIGHYLAGGRPALVYMQNSGLGNAVNPITSLAAREVYGIPMILMIGWRGEIRDDDSQIKDEPQHIKQGRITPGQLELLDIPYKIIDKNTRIDELIHTVANEALKRSGPVALVVRKGSFSPFTYRDEREEGQLLSREEVIETILKMIPENSPIVSTTGKTSRELFELRKTKNEGHQKDFLTVGGMGHASQIAAGIANSLPEKTVYCLDGDGAVLMHMGGLVISSELDNLKHIVLNNGAHDSVGGQPTRASEMNLADVAKTCGYKTVISAASFSEIVEGMDVLNHADESVFMEIKCSRGARKNLSRPDRSPQQNKDAFMDFLIS